MNEIFIFALCRRLLRLSRILTSRKNGWQLRIRRLCAISFSWENEDGMDKGYIVTPGLTAGLRNGKGYDRCQGRRT